MVVIIIIIIITRPKPAYGQQGLAGCSLRASGAQLGNGKWWFSWQTNRHTLHHYIYIIYRYHLHNLQEIYKKLTTHPYKLSLHLGNPVIIILIIIITIIFIYAICHMWSLGWYWSNFTKDFKWIWMCLPNVQQFLCSLSVFINIMKLFSVFSGEDCHILVTCPLSHDCRLTCVTCLLSHDCNLPFHVKLLKLCTYVCITGKFGLPCVLYEVKVKK